ncbi:hypothetical protein [Rubellicoccus peritrichatus]|uniref:Uncharacterized protein n=1 Tax=Rubellicoccus peritrichatus TaxID=3080537 RepID=A0AAQ3L627_9BACT|nr:hypothetical protein [Puniceicoccus sp. CR14]WOO39935.1 hypothetical protein RZN69_15015 [Puniceicoccus sp. CR14]
MLGNDVNDSWWVAIDGEVLDNLLSLPDVGKIKDQHPAAQVSVLHEGKADQEDAEWIPFEKNEPARFKVVSSRGYDGMQVTVPQSKEAEEEKPGGPEEEAAAEDKAEASTEKEEVEAKEPEEKAPKTKAKKDRKKKETAEPKADASQKTEILPEAVQKELESLKSEVKSLRDEVSALRDLADTLKQPIMEAHRVLAEREQFLEASEANLFDKAQKQEVLQTELEQMREELDEQKAALKAREARLSAG